MFKNYKSILTLVALLLTLLALGYILYKPSTIDDDIELSGEYEENKITKKQQSNKKSLKTDKATKSDYSSDVDKETTAENSDTKDVDSEPAHKLVVDTLKDFNSKPESKYIEGMLKSTIGMMYKKFFDQEGIDPETKEKVTKTLTDTMKLQTVIMKSAFEKDADINSILEKQNMMRNNQQKELNDAFSDERLVSDFKEFRNNIASNMLKKQTENQNKKLGFSPEVIDELVNIQLKHSDFDSTSNPLNTSEKELLELKEGGIQARQKKMIDDSEKACNEQIKVLREKGLSDEEINSFEKTNASCRMKDMTKAIQNQTK